MNADLDVGGDGDSHHAIVGEEGERQEREKQVPEELGCTHKSTAVSLSVSICILQPCRGPQTTAKAHVGTQAAVQLFNVEARMLTGIDLEVDHEVGDAPATQAAPDIKPPSTQKGAL